MAINKFYFCWIAENETFGPSHHRNDENVFAFELEHTEGDYASLVLDVVNPKIGLLNPSRPKWCYFSVEKDGTVIPLFKGKILGVADDMAKDFVRITFLARSSNFPNQKATLADTLRVLPHYDPLWINEANRAEPDTVLEARTALFNIDRVTHAVTISDVINGEDGLIDFGTNIYHDDTNISYRSVTSRIDMTATVQWDQMAKGSVDLTNRVRQAFGGSVTSFTGDGLRKDWPRKGDNIGSGWKVGAGTFCERTGSYGTGVRNVLCGDKMYGFQYWPLHVGFVADYDVERSRSETISFTVVSDVQALITDPDESPIEVMNLSASDADQPIDPGGLYPVRESWQNTFFKTPRGVLSLQYLLNKARAKLLASARAIEVTCSVPFEMAMGVTTRHNARFEDPRIPGGEALGKVVGYTLSMSGDSGALQATVTIGCMCGKGTTVSAVPGTPSYVDDGYVSDGYQARFGEVDLTVQGDLGYTSFYDQPIADDGVNLNDLTAFNSVLSCVVSGTAAEQGLVLNRTFVDVQEAITALNDIYTLVGLSLRPLKAGPFQTNFNIQVTRLSVPKTIDLET